jgi:hypothetical protein
MLLSRHIGTTLSGVSVNLSQLMVDYPIVSVLEYVRLMHVYGTMIAVKSLSSRAKLVSFHSIMLCLTLRRIS